jgi:hypothetical protein
MKNFCPVLEALEGIEILFAPHFQLWVGRFLEVSAELREVNFISETEDARVRVDESPPETRGPMAREGEMEIENMGGHLGQYAGEAADSFADSSEHFTCHEDVLGFEAVKP